VFKTWPEIPVGTSALRNEWPTFATLCGGCSCARRPWALRCRGGRGRMWRLWNELAPKPRPHRMLSMSMVMSMSMSMLLLCLANFRCSNNPASVCVHVPMSFYPRRLCVGDPIRFDSHRLSGSSTIVNISHGGISHE